MRSRRHVVTIPRIHVADEHTSGGDVTSNHIRAATEAGCEALLAIELLEAADGPERSVQDRSHLSQATASVRRALAELRLALTDPPGALTLGFVLGTDRPKVRRDPRRRSLQAAPDRIDGSLDAAGEP